MHEYACCIADLLLRAASREISDPRSSFEIKHSIGFNNNKKLPLALYV